MSYKNQQEGKLNLDYDFIDIDGPSTYQEMDHLFQEYCKISSMKSRTPGTSARKFPNRSLSGNSFARPLTLTTKMTEGITPIAHKKNTWESQINQSLNNIGIHEKSHVQIQDEHTFASRVHSLILKSNTPGWALSEDDVTQ